MNDEGRMMKEACSKLGFHHSSFIIHPFVYVHLWLNYGYGS